MSWLTIFLMSLVTYFTRALIFMFNFEIPDKFKRFLSFVPYSILSSIIFSNLLIKDKKLLLTWENDNLIVGCILIGIAAFVKKPLIVIPVGIALIVCIKVFF